MKIAYFDCSSGIAGNMILGSLIDAGLDPNYLKKELKKLIAKEKQLQKSEFKPPGFVPGKRMDQTRYGAFHRARKWVKRGQMPFVIFWRYYEWHLEEEKDYKPEPDDHLIIRI